MFTLGRLVVPRAAAGGLTRRLPGHVAEVAERPGADEEVAEDDEEAEHVLLRHHQHQAELDQVEPRADAGLHAVDDAPLACLHILLGIGDISIRASNEGPQRLHNLVTEKDPISAFTFKTLC